MGPNRHTVHYEFTVGAFVRPNQATYTATKKNVFVFVFDKILFGLFAWQPVRSREIGGRWFVQTAVMQLECADSPGPDSVDVGFSLSKKNCNFFCFRAQEE